MPLYSEAEENIRSNLISIANGQRPPVIEIGAVTHEQFIQINASRVAFDLPEIRENSIVFIGRHLFNSRHADGYTIDDMIIQIASSLSDASIVLVHRSMTAIQNPAMRYDQYGNAVNDRAVFEATARKPRMELFSVIPKGDTVKPVDVKLKI